MSMTREKKNNAPETDKLPPHSMEAEQAVIGGIVEAPTEGMCECAEAGVTTDWFYDVRHQVLYGALHEMDKEGKGIDTITLYQWLKDRNQDGDMGGLPYLSEVRDKGLATMVGHYLGILREKFLLRRMLAISTGTALATFEESDRPDELLAKLEKQVLALGEERPAREVKLREAILNVINEMDDYHRGGAQIRGLSTGLDGMDKLLLGIGGKHGNYIVLSGRPGTGKTALATQIALHAALDYVWYEPVMEAKGGVMVPVMEGDKFKLTSHRGVPVGIFSLEMATDALAQRMLFQRAGGDLPKWNTGFGEQRDLPKLANAAARLGASNIWIDDEGRCTIDTLKAKARRMWKEHGIKLFVIDYIQLMRGGKRVREDRVQELAEISAELQKLGKEMNVPLIVLAQMNRDYEKDPNRKPRLSDLKDCGSIEQDADVVGFLYSPKLKKETDEKTEALLTEAYGVDWSKQARRVHLEFCKNRYGQDGEVALVFRRNCTFYHDWYQWLKEKGFKDPAKGEKEPTTAEEQELERMT